MLLPSPLGEERADARAKMDAVVAAVREDPTSFERYQQQYCCTNADSWTAGRGPDVQLEVALEKLREGEIALAPIETAFGLYLVKRLPLPQPAPRSVLVQLPALGEPDLNEVLRNISSAELARALAGLRQSLSGSNLPEQARAQLDELLASTSDQLARVPAEQRPSVLASFWDGAASALPPAQVAALRSHVLGFATQQLMQD